MLSTVTTTPNSAANSRRISIPAGALGQWLADIDDPAELKVTLRTVAILAPEPHRRGIPPSLSLYDLLDDKILRKVHILETDGAIRQALAAALHRGTLVAVRHQGEIRFLLNDDHCRQFLHKMRLPALSENDVINREVDETSTISANTTISPSAQRANIFALHEEHIGTYGYWDAEQMKAAEKEYPAPWIEYAFSIASKHNARSWSYVNTILRRMVRDGLPDAMVTSNEHGKFGNDSQADCREELLEQYRRLFGRPDWESPDGEPVRSGY